ncbi:MAG: DUF559 domain-containing protein [Actinomycetota bacterium]|nr:DUF559 domain-containing protein [Actinomycetota bacterium]
MDDGSIAALAGAQHGLFSRGQALEAGVTPQLIGRRLRAGRWLSLAPGVYGHPGWPDSWRRRLWMAHLDVGPGSVISHESAAALHHLSLFRPGPVVLTVVHGDHERPAPWTVRQSTDLRPDHVTRVEGLPVTTPARTLFDIAAFTSEARLARAVDEAHVSGVCRVEELAALYEALRRRGKRGMKVLGHVVASRGDGYVPPESVLERRLLKVLRDGGLPEPVPQLPLPWRSAREGRVDVAYPQARILVEADSRRWHSRMDQMADDRRRDREALNHGWRTYRFVWEEITRQPHMVCETLREALRLFPST